MNPEQALQLLDGIAQQVNMNRAQHMTAVRAVMCIRQALSSVPQPETIPAEVLSGPALVE